MCRLGEIGAIWGLDRKMSQTWVEARTARGPSLIGEWHLDRRVCNPLNSCLASRFLMDPWVPTLRLNSGQARSKAGTGGAAWSHSSYFYFFLLTFFDAGLWADFFASLGTGLAGSDFSGALGCGFAGTGVAG